MRSVQGLLHIYSCRAGCPHPAADCQNPRRAREGRSPLAFQSWSAACTATTQLIFLKENLIFRKKNLLSKVNRETEKKLESRQPCPNTEKSVQQTHRRREELRNRKKFSPSKRAGYTFFSNPARSSRCKQRWRLTSGSKNLGTETSVSTVRKSPLHVRSRCAGICSDRQSLQLSWIFLQLPFYKYRNKQGSLVVSGA